MDKITQTQIYMLYTQYLYTTTLTFTMPLLIKTTPYMAWVSVILGSILGLLITYPACRLATKRPRQNFATYGKEIIGKWLHFPLYAVMLCSTFIIAAFIFRELLDLISEVYLQETPEWAVAILFGCTFAYAVRSGIMSLFRAAQGFFFISLTWIFAMPMFTFKEMNFSRAIALVNHIDVGGMWNGTYLMAGHTAEMVFIIFLCPFFTEIGQTMKSLSWATLTSGLIILINLISAILLFGPGVASNLMYPELEMIRYIPPGGFFENLDPIIIAIWLTSLFVKTSLLLYISVIGFTHMLGLKDHKPFSLSMTALMLGLALLIVRTASELNHLFAHGIASFLVFTALIPALYLGADWIGDFRRKPKNS